MLASIKKDAGKKEMRMIIRSGSPLNEKEKETYGKWREYVKCNTNNIFLKSEWTRTGTSEMEIKNASLTEYDGKTLTIYYPGKREMNEDEKRIMAEWQKIADTEEYKEQREIDLLTDGSTTYYQKKYFFIDKGYEYLLGFDYQKGLKRDMNSDLIIDTHIKGEINMQYEVRDKEVA